MLFSFSFQLMELFHICCYIRLYANCLLVFLIVSGVSSVICSCPMVMYFCYFDRCLSIVLVLLCYFIFLFLLFIMLFLLLICFIIRLYVVIVLIILFLKSCVQKSCLLSIIIHKCHMHLSGLFDLSLYFLFCCV